MAMTLRQRSLGLKAMLVASIGIGVIAGTGHIGEAHPRHRAVSAGWIEPSILSGGFRDGEGLASSSDRTSFMLGRDFSLAAFNASRLKKDPHATKHLIVDLVYLMDRLEGSREAGSLRRVLTQVVRETEEREVIAAEIEREGQRYRARLKGAELWNFDIGHAALHLTLASYNNAESTVREDIARLKALADSVPQGISAAAIEKIAALQKFAGDRPIADEDYQRIFYATWELLEALGG